MSRFHDCLNIVLGHEGGISNHKADRGGLTSRGVTQARYDEYRVKRGLQKRQVSAIDLPEVDDIYGEYWREAHCAYMPEPLDLMLLDAGINHSPKRAIKLLQRALGVDEDGVCGRNTMTALHEEVICEGVEHVCELYLKAREAFYDAIIANDPTQAAFARGWTNRVDHLREMIA